ncbi:hypothetical protein PAECIP111893_02401 [Paenibacillus plantiphilus]|uniref:Phage ABA sandwich domain-containing protein n=1 Tax=Paenibacillus plantiphilus TaxID=2905650 RepID=A0ABM9C8N7_9BACL|nr:hypothetical protein [Paenibacillus plantiphilus]CAH1205719.1 hypothetical protein PAECIP111893_02401 [Paenibacillus plantiphilus]
MNKEEVIAKWNNLSLRERDAWIAETLMGLELDKYRTGNYLKGGMSIPIKRYSSYTSVAMDIITKITDKSEHEGCGPCVRIEHDGIWHVSIGIKRAMNESLPEAICLAALIAHYETN